MRKWIIIFGFLILNFQTVVASSVNGLDLPSATDQAIADISNEIDKDSIFAWESSVQEDEVIVKFINTDGIQAKYGCHDHDKEMVCHEELFRQTDDRHRKDPEVTADFIRSGHLEALSKFKRTLQRRGKDLSVVTAIKVWTHEEGDDDGGHEHGVDVWTKIKYNTGTPSTIFAVCHVHGDDKSFSCHYRRGAEGEPTLSFK